MPFKSREELGGQLDPKINREGRIPKKGEKPSRKKQRNRELESLLRKLKPNVSKSIMVAVKIMDREQDVTDTSKLKAATIILDLYKSTVLELGKEQEDDDFDEEEQAPATVFSLVMTQDEKETDN